MLMSATQLANTDTGWVDLAASALALVVQHCSAGSMDPRTLCTLLQVSTACRTALQHTHGDCRIFLQGSEQKLTSYAAWLPQHTRIVSESHVECSTSTNLSEELSAASSKFSAALEQLSNLRSLRLTSTADDAFSDEVISGLSCTSQLTHVRIEKLGVSALSSLPQFLTELDVKVDVAQLLRNKPSSAAEQHPGHCEVRLSLQHLTVLRRCGVWVVSSCRVGGYEGMPGLSGRAYVILQLPSQLTALHLTGAPINQVLTGEDPKGLFPSMVAFSASGSELATACHPDTLVRLVRRMPQLSSVCLNGFLMPGGFMGAGVSLASEEVLTDMVPLPSPMFMLAAQGLAQALAAATFLTAVTIVGYNVFRSSSESAVRWGAELAHLRGLNDLHFNIDLRDDDLLALTVLTDLTSLRLVECGEEVSRPAVVTLCEKLTQLQVLSITGAGLDWACRLFPTLLKLTDLRVLCLDHNYGMTCMEPDVWSLLSLEGLTDLTLPPGARESCIGSTFEAFMAEMPRLQRLSCAGRVYTQSESLCCIVGYGLDE